LDTCGIRLSLAMTFQRNSTEELSAGY